MRRNFISRIGVTAALLLAGSSLALAQAAATGDASRAAKSAQDALIRNGAESWDANHDGIYTCDEWKSHLDRMFTLADRNRDGHLDAAEFDMVRKVDAALADADFGYFDENQDGKITRNEFVNKPSQFILRFDRNGDCRVTPDEMKAAQTPSSDGPPTRQRDRFHQN